MWSAPNKCKLFDARGELTIQPFFMALNINQTLNKQVKNVIKRVEVYSPAARAPAWLGPPIAAEWRRHSPWSAMVTQGVWSAEESWQHRGLRRPLSESQMGCCIQTASDHHGHSWQTSLQETETNRFEFKISLTVKPQKIKKKELGI